MHKQNIIVAQILCKFSVKKTCNNYIFITETSVKKEENKQKIENIIVFYCKIVAFNTEDPSLCYK